MERRRFALYDSLRALAALAVIFHHVGAVSEANLHASWGAFTSHLNVGVTLFFLISGFLLYRPHAVALLEGSAPPALGPYVVRRFLRIAPAYWVALTLLELWPGLLGVFGSDWWLYYGFAQSLRRDGLFIGIGPAWSLSVEVGFYALLPALAAGIAWACRGRDREGRARMALALLAALGAFGLASRAAIHAGPRALELTLPNWLLWFAAGMSLAVASARLEGDERGSRAARFAVERPGLCWSLALALYIGVCLSPSFPRALARDYTTAAHAVEHVLYAAIALLVMLPATFGEDAGGWPRRVLGNRTLLGIGVISYGIFLWHGPLLVAMRDRGLDRWLAGSRVLSLAVAILPVALACGWLSYHLVERPAQGLARRDR
jgi:peptidoglycan/LPS O-acetylase OafA/YrhL